MKYRVRLVPSANEDLDYYATREQKIILDAIETFLESDADMEGRRRK